MRRKERTKCSDSAGGSQGKEPIIYKKTVAQEYPWPRLSGGFIHSIGLFGLSLWRGMCSLAVEQTYTDASCDESQ